jgi:hypothetical protein
MAEPQVDDEIDDESSSETVRAKWAMDGATTLSEAAAKLVEFADELKKLEADGWQLAAPVNDDYGFIERVVAAE